jgi:deoxyribonuclease V
MGLASHMGILLGIPSVGCAKSRLTGEYVEPGGERGDWTPLRDDGELVGRVVRTRAGVKPVFVSVGHRLGLAAATRLVLSCLRGYRLPEPTRRAHQLVSAFRKQYHV